MAIRFETGRRSALVFLTGLAFSLSGCGLIVGEIKSIVNNESSQGIEFSSSEVRIVEGRTATVTISSNRQSTQAYSLTWQVNGSGVAGDVVDLSGSIEFPAGESSISFPIRTSQNLIFDLSREYSLSVSSPSPEIKPFSSKFTVDDDENVPEIKFAAGALANATEGDGNKLLRIEVEPVSKFPIVVNYSVNPSSTATLNVDYELPAVRSVTVDPLSPNSYLSFVILDDTEIEPPETVVIDLVSISTGTATIASPNSVTVTLIDNDSPNLYISDINVTEGGTATFTATLSTAALSDVSFDWATQDGTANSVSDYFASSGSRTIATSVTSTTFSVNTMDNTTICQNERTFSVQLSNVVGATVADSIAIATIIDNDRPEISFSQAASTVMEGSPQTLEIRLSAPCPRHNIGVRYATSNGTAVAPSDYLPVNASLATITAGQTATTIELLTVNDNLFELDETFNVVLSNPTEATLGAQASHVVTIQNDDPIPVIYFPSSSSAAKESDGIVSISVALTAVSGADAVADVLLSGSATSPADYLAPAATITIPAGSTSAKIDIPIVDDSIEEVFRKTVRIVISPSSGCLTSGFDEHILSILNDDFSNFTWRGTTNSNWNVGANWIGGVVPGPGDTARFSPGACSGAGCNVTVNAPGANVAGVVFNEEFNGVITQGAQPVSVGNAGWIVKSTSASTWAGGTGNLVVDGNMIHEGGTFNGSVGNISINGRLDISGLAAFRGSSNSILISRTTSGAIFRFDNTSGATFNNGGVNASVELRGDSSTDATYDIEATAPVGFGNLILSAKSGSASNVITFRNGAPSVLSVQGNLTIARHSGTATINLNGANYSVQGNLTAGAGSGGGTSSVSFTGNRSPVTYTQVDDGISPRIIVAKTGDGIVINPGSTNFTAEDVAFRGANAYTFNLPTTGQFTVKPRHYDAASLFSFNNVAGAAVNSGNVLIDLDCAIRSDYSLDINTTQNFKDLSVIHSGNSCGTGLVFSVKSGSLPVINGNLLIKNANPSSSTFSLQSVATPRSFDVHGNVTLDGLSSAPLNPSYHLNFKGANPQSVFLNSSINPFNGHWTVAKTGGQVDLLTNVANAASLTIISGRMNLNANNFNAATTIDTAGSLYTGCGTPGAITNNGGVFAHLIGDFSFNGNGTLTTGFTNPIVNQGSSRADVKKVALQSDGKIVLTGDFSNINGVVKSSWARLHANGSLDSSFTQMVPSQGRLQVQADDKILFNPVENNGFGNPIASIARLNADGSRDSTFADVVAPYGSGALPFHHTNAGSLFSFLPTLDIDFNQISLVPRLFTSNGVHDGSLSGQTIDNANGDPLSIFDTVEQSDGKFLIAHTGNRYGMAAQPYLMRIHSDGSLDASFATGSGFDFAPNQIKIQADGKILAFGHFNTYNGTPVGKIARLNPNGSLDSTFDIGTGPGSNHVRDLYVQSDGKLLIGGDFTSFNGVSAPKRLVRLNSDGSIDASFSQTDAVWTNPVSALALSSSGQIVVGRSCF